MPTFTPPTFEEGINTKERPLCYFRLTQSTSVVRISGVLTSVRTPSADQLVGLVDGVDYFIGGHIYNNVSETVAAELEAGGFPITITGYGLGAYGLGLYGI